MPKRRCVPKRTNQLSDLRFPFEYFNLIYPTSPLSSTDSQLCLVYNVMTARSVLIPVDAGKLLALYGTSMCTAGQVAGML